MNSLRDTTLESNPYLKINLTAETCHPMQDYF